MQGKSHPLLNHGRLQPLGQRGLHLRRFWAMWLLHPAFLFYHAVYQTFHGNIEPCAFNDSDSQQHLNAELNHQLYFHFTETTPKTKPSHVPGQPGCPPTRCQDPQLNLFMKCSGLRTRLWGRAQNGRSPKEAPKTAMQEAFFEPSCNQQSLHQRALTSLSGTIT